MLKHTSIFHLAQAAMMTLAALILVERGVGQYVLYVVLLLILMWIAHAGRHQRQRSLTDPLTGAYNREGLQEITKTLFTDRSAVSLLFIDLDDFGQVNKEVGHLVGDMMLKTTVTATRSVLRTYDSIFRYGGDEFVVILPRTDQAACLLVRERVITALINYGVRASVGEATSPSHGRDLADLLHFADLSMSRHKKRHLLA